MAQSGSWAQDEKNPTMAEVEAHVTSLLADLDDPPVRKRQRSNPNEAPFTQPTVNDLLDDAAVDDDDNDDDSSESEVGSSEEDVDEVDEDGNLVGFVDDHVVFDTDSDNDEERPQIGTSIAEARRTSRAMRTGYPPYQYIKKRLGVVSRSMERWARKQSTDDVTWSNRDLRKMKYFSDVTANKDMDELVQALKMVLQFAEGEPYPKKRYHEFYDTVTASTSTTTTVVPKEESVTIVDKDGNVTHATIQVVDGKKHITFV